MLAIDDCYAAIGFYRQQFPRTLLPVSQVNGAFAGLPDATHSAFSIRLPRRWSFCLTSFERDEVAFLAGPFDEIAGALLQLEGLFGPLRMVFGQPSQLMLFSLKDFAFVVGQNDRLLARLDRRSAEIGDADRVISMLADH
ncbi:hypothetical protein [Allomesorhizobium alhagi]|uniref:Uncharacterized protein n=1 Tax=Mesorhizobium alhagi CCNWXJ12-2 TaxID=1107882 RepID=H0HYY1_9HYPH|nr:hypothetical protein [Mesorhizobium alhagi]EHK54061.1 hypothetical protein MAXJ12_27078 [Mesorhizobium alhagi CCNWXJ12-2]